MVVEGEQYSNSLKIDLQPERYDWNIIRYNTVEYIMLSWTYHCLFCRLCYEEYYPFDPNNRNKYVNDLSMRIWEVGTNVQCVNTYRNYSLWLITSFIAVIIVEINVLFLVVVPTRTHAGHWAPCPYPYFHPCKITYIMSWQTVVGYLCEFLSY